MYAKKRQKNLTIFRTIASVAMVAALTACSSPPTLSQVDSSATEKPINTPEMAAQLKALNER